MRKEVLPPEAELESLATDLAKTLVQRQDLYAKQLDDGRYICIRKPLTSRHLRTRMIHEFVHCYLKHLKFGGVQLCISREPVSIRSRIFSVPDCRFGGSRVLSVRGTPGAQHVSLDNLGDTRLALLRDKDVGFYNQDPLDRQYFVFPQSVFESYGIRFLDDLGRNVEELFHQSYDPIVVTYNDRVPKTFPAQGKAILDTVRAECQKPGYGVVMIHHLPDRQVREEDQLAAMVVRELRQFDLYVSVIHSAVGRECYRLVNRQNGEPFYGPRRGKRGKLAGYLRNVALTKVLLTNQRWPFVLETRLHADIVIGIDVKHNTAGLVVVGSNGAEIRALLKTSRQKERLREDQLKAYLVGIIRKEAETRTELIRTIVIHRDGRFHQSELEGAQQAIAMLKQEGTIGANATLTILDSLPFECC